MKAALQNVDIWVPQIPTKSDPPAPYHYGFFDRTGAGLAVEFYNNQMHLFDNPVGALTNGPAFDWHLKNLQNYAFVSNINQNQQTFRGYTAQAEDNGIATSGLPAANTSQGRFVRAAYYTNFAHPPKVGTDPLVQLGHMMNNFDRPSGITQDPESTVATGHRSTEWTIWSTLHDTAENRMQLRADTQLNWMEFRHSDLSTVTEPLFVPLEKLTASDDPTRTFLDG